MMNTLKECRGQGEFNIGSSRLNVFSNFPKPIIIISDSFSILIGSQNKFRFYSWIPWKYEICVDYINSRCDLIPPPNTYKFGMSALFMLYKNNMFLKCTTHIILYQPVISWLRTCTNYCISMVHVIFTLKLLRAS
jgi:hypothetical protein